MMITFRINIIALIVAGMVWFAFYSWLSQEFSAMDVAKIAIAVLSTSGTYSFIANMPAFKSKKNEGKK